jgi:hypothetical protein
MIRPQRFGLWLLLGVLTLLLLYRWIRTDQP